MSTERFTSTFGFPFLAPFTTSVAVATVNKFSKSLNSASEYPIVPASLLKSSGFILAKSSALFLNSSSVKLFPFFPKTSFIYCFACSSLKLGLTTVPAGLNEYWLALKASLRFLSDFV